MRAPKPLPQTSPAPSPATALPSWRPPAPSIARAMDAGLRILAGRYKVEWDPSLLSRNRYLAGDDARRGSELAAALADPEVRGVVAARGGYGSMRILSEVWPIAGGRLSSPGPAKMVVGFSDITALHAALQATGRVSVHGPVVTQLGTQPPAVVERFFALLENGDGAARADRGHAGRRGRRRGAAPRGKPVPPHAASRHPVAARPHRRGPAPRGHRRAAVPHRPHVDASPPGRGLRPGGGRGARRVHRLRDAGRGVHAPGRPLEPGRRDGSAVRRRASRSAMTR